MRKCKSTKCGEKLFFQAISFVVIFGVMAFVFSGINVYADEDTSTKEFVLVDINSIVWKAPLSLVIRDAKGTEKTHGTLEISTSSSLIEKIEISKHNNHGSYRVEFANIIAAIRAHKGTATLVVPKGKLRQLVVHGTAKVEMKATPSDEYIDIVLSGIGDIAFNILRKVKVVKITNNGTGTIRILELDGIDHATVTNKGMGHIRLGMSRDVEHIKLVLEGTGSIEGAKAHRMSVSFSGVGKLYVEARDTLTVEKISGLATLRYRGAKPKVLSIGSLSKVKPW